MNTSVPSQNHLVAWLGTSPTDLCQGQRGCPVAHARLLPAVEGL